MDLFQGAMIRKQEQPCIVASQAGNLKWTEAAGTLSASAAARWYLLHQA